MATVGAANPSSLLEDDPLMRGGTLVTRPANVGVDVSSSLPWVLRPAGTLGDTLEDFHTKHENVQCQFANVAVMAHGHGCGWDRGPSCGCERS